VGQGREGGKRKKRIRVGRSRLFLRVRDQKMGGERRQEYAPGFILLVLILGKLRGKMMGRGAFPSFIVWRREEKVNVKILQ